VKKLMLAGMLSSK